MKENTLTLIKPQTRNFWLEKMTREKKFDEGLFII